ncbi:MAG: hypothetical protein Q8R02_19190 [Hyphomonadaceae bacterium]|nr:hypothetical protein [Hyphomonadaceae bacterium]
MSDLQTPAQPVQQAAPSKRTLLLSVAGAGLVAVLIIFVAVLPAEYNRDPLGLGRLTGLSRLWAPKQVAVATDAAGGPSARREPAAFRTDSFEIPLAPDGDEARRNALEFKVKVNKGSMLIYRWRVEGLSVPEDLMFDFHGHTVAGAAQGEVSVADYERASGAEANGSLVAPIDGIHGWYFRNRSDKPLRIRVQLAGYYQLIPAGQQGNLAGIEPEGSAPPRGPQRSQ